MALHRISNAPALPLALSAIPSVPRPLLNRLVARAIERLHELDEEPDLKDAGTAEPENEE